MQTLCKSLIASRIQNLESRMFLSKGSKAVITRAMESIALHRIYMVLLRTDKFNMAFSTLLQTTVQECRLRGTDKVV